MSSVQSFEYDPQEIVPVIASFDTDGHIRPLYVRILGNSYKVLSQWSNQCFAGIIEFNCKVEVRGCSTPLLLKYYSREKVWTIPGDIQ